MSAKATPTSSVNSPKGKGVPTPTPRSLDEEMKDADASDEEVTFTAKVYKTLQRRIQKNDNDLAHMQTMMNETITKLEDKTMKAAQLEEQVKTLQAAANIINTPLETRDKLKLNNPQTFDGTPGHLKGFLTQVRAYHRFHNISFVDDTEKVIHAASFLKGKALAWFEPHLMDFMTKSWEQLKPETQEIFIGYHGFEKALLSLFQDTDEKRQAERDLSSLRQTKSASHYAAEFRRLSARLDITNESKTFMFYQGLKEEVKDELVKIITPPEEFLEYVELAIRIDTRLYERRKEKGENRRPQANSARKYIPQGPKTTQFNNGKNNQQRNQSTAYGYHSGPMDLSATQKERPQRRYTKNDKCYNCDKIGHHAYECRGPKREGFRPVPEKAKNLSMTRKTPHAQLTWTTCYDDNCATHQDSKEQAGWYPKEPPTKTLAAGYKTGNESYPRPNDGNDNSVEIPTWRPIEESRTQKLQRLTSEQSNELTQEKTYGPINVDEHNLRCIRNLQNTCIIGIRRLPEKPELSRTLHVVIQRIRQRLNARNNFHKLRKLEKELHEELEKEQGQTVKTLAMGRRTPNQKVARKAREQLDEMLQIQEYRAQTPSTVYPESSISETTETAIEIPPQYQRQLQLAADNYQYYDTSSYAPEATGSDATTEPRRTLQRTPSIDDTSSEDEEEDNIPRRIMRRTVYPDGDDQWIELYGLRTHQAAMQSTTPLRLGDHAILNPEHPRHRTIFWAECIQDYCIDHMAQKYEHQFFPRRYGTDAIPEVYLDSQLALWEFRNLDEQNVATFTPSPAYPMKCLNKIITHWEDCRTDKCRLHYVPKAEAWRYRKQELEKQGKVEDRPSPPRLKIASHGQSKNDKRQL